jgi:aspartyl-tRNA(Asn)/glutamyl-tRNA(Gln) amidotransferase subunit B
VRVGLALDCEIHIESIFARKNYFYPDLPKGYQISQYDQPLATDGKIQIETGSGPKDVRIRRVHLEEDTGKLSHADGHSFIDYNRSGVPLLEIVTEPDLRSPEEVRAYATKLHAILRYLGVNSGDMEKGVIRFEANVSVRAEGSDQLNTRT